MNALFLYCRSGFEPECAAEIQAVAARFDIAGYCKARETSGYVLFIAHESEAAARLHAAVSLRELIFTRQWFVVLALRNDLPPGDRISPILADLGALPAPVASVLLETPDTNEAKSLSGLCRAIARPLEVALQTAGRRRPSAALQLHVCFLSTNSAYIGYAVAEKASSWPGGVPRLRSPAGAPSRSTLKLEEALLTFLDAQERERLLQPGMQAVDLGAAPGGWTWQLVKRHLRVVAVDNGPMDEALLQSGLVEHRREDGFRYRPTRPVDWMVCDIVEQPIRVADLAAAWLGNGWCAHSIFNLKLPMKKRFQEVRRCLERVEQALLPAGHYRLYCKQLYHDREEVTVYAERG